jgi:diguanylate cyclase (GGDEF)-like protein
MRPKIWPAVAWLALLYYLSASLGMQLFALQPSNMTLIWLPSGIGLVMLVRYGWRALPLILLASLAANYPGLSGPGIQQGLLHASLSALVDTLSAALAAWLLRCRLPEGLQRARELGAFCFYVCLLPSALGASLICVNLFWGDYLNAEAAWQLWLPLLLGDSLGLLLVFPLYQAWRELGRPTAREWRWIVVLGLANLLLILLAFNGFSGLLYLILPALLWLLLKVRLQGLYLTLLLSMVAVLAVAARQLGPFRGLEPGEAHLMLLGFVATCALVILFLGLHYRQLQLADASRAHWQSEALHDPLTGLLNRRAFTPLLAAEHQRVQRTQRPCALALLDLDHFKRVNDQYGHGIGDGVLVQLAVLMQQHVRDIDSVARVGGEEFAILFPEASAEEAAQALERIRLALASQPLQIDGEQIAITVSSGVVGYNGGPQSAEDLLEGADDQLYRAKHGGRNCVMLAEDILPAA